MSKLVKDTITDELKKRFQGVTDLFVVNTVGIDGVKTQDLRKNLRAKGITLLMVKNSLARRATEGTVLAPAFTDGAGTTTIVYGAADVVQLAKEITKLTSDKKMAPFSAQRGVVGGAKITGEEVAAVSKWPTREEQLSILVGQILGPGSRLVALLNGPGGALASQIKEKAGGDSADAADAAAADATPAAGEAPAEPVAETTAT